MALYAGGTKISFVLGQKICGTRLYSSVPITNGVRLLTSDGNLLVDSKKLYVTSSIRVKLLSLDDCILQDIENKYLTVKKG